LGGQPPARSAQGFLSSLGPPAPAPAPAGLSPHRRPSAGEQFLQGISEQPPPPPPGGPPPPSQQRGAAGFLSSLDQPQYARDPYGRDPYYNDRPPPPPPPLEPPPPPREDGGGYPRHVGGGGGVVVGGGGAKARPAAEMAASAWELNYRRQALLPAPADAAQTAQTNGYCLSLTRVQGAALPAALAKLLDDASRRGEATTVSHKLLVSLFDADQPSFFGRTWEGPEQAVQPRQLRSASFDVEHGTDLFVHSRLHGPRCRAIVENVFVLRHAGRTTEHAGGWAMLRPFERPDALRDLQSERRGAGGRSAPAREDQQMEQLQQGSPLALLQLPPHQHGHLRRSGGQLVFALRAHRQLALRCAHLMPENGLFSADQPLPGLLPQRQPSGDFEPAALHQPTPQTCFALSVSAVALSYPAALEARLLRKLHDDASAAAGGGAGGAGGGSIGARRQAGQGVAAAGHFRVVARRLVLGVHSGHVVCAAPQLLPLQEAPASTPAGTFPDARPADLRLRTVGGASVSLEGFAL